MYTQIKICPYCQVPTVHHDDGTTTCYSCGQLHIRERVEQNNDDFTVILLAVRRNMEVKS